MNPTSTADDHTTRFRVQSADGTSLAVWVDGSGPSLVMVHGSIADHTTFDPFVEVLRDDLTTFSMDRRGFGASGDAPGYSIEQDFEDVAAVVDAVDARTGKPVALWGHSYGANCAMGGAALTDNVHHLVLYEPSLGIPYPRMRSRPARRRWPTGQRRRHRRRPGGHPGDDRGRDRRLARQPVVARPPRRRPHHPKGVSSRERLGLPTRPVRHDHGTDAHAGMLLRRR